MAIGHYSHELALSLAIILTGISQTLLRLGARDQVKSISSLLNLKTLSGYILFLLVILLMIYCMQEIKFRNVIAWNSLTFIITPILAHLIAKDTLSKRIVAGSVLIVFGITIFAL